MKTANYYDFHQFWKQPFRLDTGDSKVIHDPSERGQPPSEGGQHTR